jgi:hypothetical protein
MIVERLKTTAVIKWKSLMVQAYFRWDRCGEMSLLDTSESTYDKPLLLSNRYQDRVTTSTYQKKWPSSQHKPQKYNNRPTIVPPKQTTFYTTATHSLLPPTRAYAYLPKSPLYLSTNQIISELRLQQNPIHPIILPK